VTVNLEPVPNAPTAPPAPYVFFSSFHLLNPISNHFIFHRIRALRALPLWAKIAMAAAVFTVVAGGVTAPVVYSSLKG
jgi:hypothetical protein